MGPDQRVLDIASGVGDVAMLAANLVGPSGEVGGDRARLPLPRPGQGSRTLFCLGKTFVFLDPWPAGWLLADDPYVDFVNEQYSLFDVCVWEAASPCGSSSE
jgi:hypothetical protein